LNRKHDKAKGLCVDFYKIIFF